VQDRTGRDGHERVHRPGGDDEGLALHHGLRGDLVAVDVVRVAGDVGRIEQIEHELTLRDEEGLLGRVGVVAETRARRRVVLSDDDTEAEGGAVRQCHRCLLNRATVVVADGGKRQSRQNSHGTLQM
jgi:hypothetical protein